MSTEHEQFSLKLFIHDLSCNAPDNIVFSELMCFIADIKQSNLI